MMAQRLLALGTIDKTVGIPGAVAQILPSVFKDTETVFAFDPKPWLPLGEDTNGLRVGIDGITRNTLGHTNGKATAVTEIVPRLHSLATLGTIGHSFQPPPFQILLSYHSFPRFTTKRSIHKTRPSPAPFCKMQNILINFLLFPVPWEKGLVFSLKMA